MTLSAKQQKMRRGPRSKRRFVQLWTNVKRSAAYHGLSPVARGFLIELLDRYTGTNNGQISFSLREAAYELHCGHQHASNAARELDDAGLVRPMKVGAWRGRQATTWRLTFYLCNETGEIPVTQWERRAPMQEEPAPKPQRPPRRPPLSVAERVRRHREKRRGCNENVTPEATDNRTEGNPQPHKPVTCNENGVAEATDNRASNEISLPEATDNRTYTYLPLPGSEAAERDETPEPEPTPPDIDLTIPAWLDRRLGKAKPCPS